MQFFFLLIINVFLGAMFYLIISLKLEKSNSVFREKKLRKEMDIIINEFNSTAERNITILENRISILKKLLDKSDEVDSIDFIIGEDLKNNKEKENIVKTDKEERKSIILKENPVIEKESLKYVSKTKKSLLFNSRKVFDRIILLYNTAKNRIVDNFKNDINQNKKIEDKNINGELSFKSDYKEYSIEKEIKLEDKNEFLSISTEDTINNLNIDIDLNASAIEEIDVVEEVKKRLTDEELYEMFNTTEDSFLLISNLFKDGYSIEHISTFAGVSVSEIGLILNLHS